MQYDTATSETCVSVSYKVKHILIPWFSNLVPKYSPKRDEDLTFTCKPYVYVYSDFIYKYPKWETVQMSFNWQMGLKKKLRYTHPWSITQHRNKQTTDSHKTMNESQIDDAK